MATGEPLVPWTGLPSAQHGICPGNGFCVQDRVLGSGPGEQGEPGVRDQDRQEGKQAGGGAAAPRQWATDPGEAS